MNAESGRVFVEIHVGASVVSDTPFVCLFQTVDIISRTPEIETILERLVDAVFNGALISVHVLHSSVDAPVGKHDAVIAKCRVEVASPLTTGMKTVHHSIFVSVHVGDSTILVPFHDVIII